MVIYSIKEIRKALPEIEHIVMFYNNGTVFKSTFEDINIPKLGDSLSGTLENLKRVYEISNFELKKYKKLVFDTDDICLIILKLGEDSNLALFFKKEAGEVDDVPEINAVRHYVTKIERILDIDRDDLLERRIKEKQRDIRKEENYIEELLESKSQLIIKLNNVVESEEIDKINGEIEDLEKKAILAKEKVDELSKDIDRIQDKQKPDNEENTSINKKPKI